MRISDWSSDVCSSDLAGRDVEPGHLPSLFGHPERVAALAAAEVECRAWGEFLYDVRDGGVHPPRPDPILAALGVAGLPLRCRGCMFFGPATEHATSSQGEVTRPAHT